MADRIDPSVRGSADVQSSRKFDMVGAPGTAVYGGYIQEREANSQLTGTQKYTKFSDTLVNVGIVGAGVRYFLNLISKATWAVSPANDSPEAKQLAEFTESVIADIDTPFRRIARRSSMYRFYGFSAQEWQAKRRSDGKIGFQDMMVRPQSTITQWDLAPSGTVLGMIQTSPQTGERIYLPRRKLVYLVDDSLSDSPEGVGLVRHIYPYAERLKVYEKLEAGGFNSDLRGIPIGRAPIAALEQMVKDNVITEAQKTEWQTNFQNFITNHIRSENTGLILDSLTYQTLDEKGQPSNVKQWDLELLKGDQSSLTDIARAIQRVTRSIAILLGVEQLLLGENSGGSYALARDKTNVFFLIVDSTLMELSEAFRQDVIKPIWLLNGFPEELMPTLSPEAIKFRDVEQVTKALKDLAAAGAKLSLKDPAVNEIRDLLGLSRIPDDLIEEINQQEQEQRALQAEAINQPADGAGGNNAVDGGGE